MILLQIYRYYTVCTGRQITNKYRILHSNKIEQTITCNNRDCMLSEKKPNTRKYTLYLNIFI